MSTFREAEIYVQGRTKRRLRWLAKALQPAPGTILPTGVTHKPATADELGDLLLNEVIEQRYPQIKDVEKEYENAERRFVESLQSAREKAA